MYKGSPDRSDAEGSMTEAEYMQLTAEPPREPYQARVLDTSLAIEGHARDADYQIATLANGHPLTRAALQMELTLLSDLYSRLNPEKSLKDVLSGKTAATVINEPRQVHRPGYGLDGGSPKIWGTY